MLIDFELAYSDCIDIKIIYHSLNKDFATHKNFLNACCNGDYIFQIDADEMPDETLIKYLPEILESNDVDAIWIPRINIVNGITPEHIQNGDGMLMKMGGLIGLMMLSFVFIKINLKLNGKGKFTKD
jgi:cellulose synthase/poly-beta-1,6-N-acetylglucosamine synthase-like glycosyltransferase